ncbi:MAG: ABC transporter permease, partial [Gemmatimonadetes bacterium]|nr:ABC transporter permease [Gemmatimonadota bacterium]NIQ56007.1 ABC transporter permease [Gemmatimonadota bacterium]NIU79507.1 ABC transporter permease [Gammaproteobacteria bacterium]NIX45732.1 ABC transporter permease [Gemmatimonadota bacterium]NIY12533.1 ABC transporter permease [Gemmatimonadota bacterium]
LLTVPLFGLPPALTASRVNVVEDLKAGGRPVGAGRRGGLQNALVVTQVALSLVLLLGAGMLVRNVVRLRHVDPGFATERALTAD